MVIDPVLIIVVAGSVGALLIERVFYYRLKYAEKKKKKPVCVHPNPVENTENPSHGERLMGLETDMENLRGENNKDHDLIRKSIDNLSTRINGVLKR